MLRLRKSVREREFGVAPFQGFGTYLPHPEVRAKRASKDALRYEHRRRYPGNGLLSYKDFCSTRRGAGAMPIEMTVYMLRCSDGSYYVGSTKQAVEARVWEHNNLPIGSCTAKRRPVVLVFTETYDRIIDAIARERQIKGWSRRKKEALIELEYEALPDLSRRGHLVQKAV